VSDPAALKNVKAFNNSAIILMSKLGRFSSSGHIVGAPISVAEPELDPEPVEQQLFAGAGGKVFFWPGM
jgi:hypothetical protein